MARGIRGQVGDIGIAVAGSQFVQNNINDVTNPLLYVSADQSCVRSRMFAVYKLQRVIVSHVMSGGTSLKVRCSRFVVLVRSDQEGKPCDSVR